MALDLIQIFKEQEYDDAVRLHENAEVLRKRFVEDYDEIEKNRLNSLFKFRLIITYLSGSIVPVVEGSTLEQYCMRVGLPYELEKKNIYRNIMLSNLKDSIPEISYRSNEVLMSKIEYS